MIDSEPFPVAPPWGKGINRVARVWGSQWCHWFGRRPHRRREITGESRLGCGEDDPDMQARCQCHLPSLLFFYSNPDFWYYCKNHISGSVDPKIVKSILWYSLIWLILNKNIK